MSIFVKDNDNGNFHYNLADANRTEEKTLGPNVRNQHNVQRITTLRTGTGNLRASKQLFQAICFRVQHF